MRWLWVLLLGLTVQGAMGQEWAVQVTTPKEGALFGWAQSAPEVAIRAELRRQGERVIAKQGDVQRLFLTAQIFSGERLLDNVPLWDDGTHGDERGGDGVYAASYRPPQAGAFRLRVRAQADILSGNKTVTREFWSGFLPFRVIAIPYARLTQPEPGSEVRGKTAVRARLLLLDKPFDEPDETLQATLLVTGEGRKRQIPLQRNGSLLTSSVTFSKRGTYRLQVSVAVQRDGQSLQTQSEVTEIQVTMLTYTWLIIAIFLAIVFLLLPPREPPLHYRHRVRFGEQVHELKPGERKSLPELPEPEVELVAEAEKREIRVRSMKGAQIRKGGGLPQQEVPLREGERCRVGETELHYERAELLRATRQWWHRLLPNTVFRLPFFLCALGAFVYWLWQWWQFAR
jgi:hypothetical protein